MGDAHDGIASDGTLHYHEGLHKMLRDPVSGQPSSEERGNRGSARAFALQKARASLSKPWRASPPY
jgi:hypothetical protein